MIRSRRVLLVFVLASLAPACSEPYAPPPIDDVHWHGDPRPAVRRWGLSQKEYSPLVLPEAGHARPDRYGPIRRLTANILPSGDLFFKGCEWRLNTDDGKEREASLHAFSRQLADLTAPLDLKAEDGTSRVPYMLHADRGAGWAHVRLVLLAGVRPEDVRLRLLEWAVWCPASKPHDDSMQVARIEGTDVGNAPPDAVRTRLDVAEAAVGISVGDRRFSFGPLPADPFSDTAFLARANGTWTDVEEHLGALGSRTETAVLRVTGDAERLPWAFVVKVLDLLYGADLRDVWLPDDGLRLTLGEPAAEPDTEDPRKDQPVVTPAVAVACVVAVLLAFAVAFLPLRR